MSEIKTGEKIELPVSLRDWFAGQALIGLSHFWDSSAESYLNDLAKRAYGISDAMLKAREVKS